MIYSRSLHDALPIWTNAADFLITANACGTTLAPGASCDVAVAFAPQTRSGPRTARLHVGGASGASAEVSLSGTALPSLGLLAGGLGGSGLLDGTGAAARVGSAGAMVSDGAGNLFFSDWNTVRKIALATGTVTTLAGRPSKTGSSDGVGANALFDGPFGFAADGAGNLFVSDSNNYTI